MMSAYSASSLPIGLNRISWEQYRASTHHRGWVQTSLPIGLNRISWELSFSTGGTIMVIVNGALPIGLNRISWEQPYLYGFSGKIAALPIGLNRISWELFALGNSV